MHLEGRQVVSPVQVVGGRQGIRLKCSISLTIRQCRAAVSREYSLATQFYGHQRTGSAVRLCLENTALRRNSTGIREGARSESIFSRAFVHRTYLRFKRRSCYSQILWFIPLFALSPLSRSLNLLFTNYLGFARRGLSSFYFL